MDIIAYIALAISTENLNYCLFFDHLVDYLHYFLLFPFLLEIEFFLLVSRKGPGSFLSHILFLGSFIDILRDLERSEWSFGLIQVATHETFGASGHLAEFGRAVLH